MQMLVVAGFLLVGLLVALSSGARLPYIVGGSDVDTPGKWPWQGSLQVTGLSHFCGCIVLSKTWMLSAASCFLLPSQMVIVLLGAHDVRTRLTGDPRYFTIDKFIKHPDFSTDDWDAGYPDDIGLIRLNKDVDLTNKFIAPAELAATTDGDFVNSECYITGWGFTLKGILPPNVLKEAKTSVMTNAECDTAWKAAIGPGLIRDGHVCVGGTGSEGACSGDSGGPLVCKSAAGSWLLVGITSWGMNTCGTQYPTVCTRVTSYRKWINDNTNGSF